VVSISAKNNTINRITLYDLLGEEIITLQPNSLVATVDVSNLANGIYIAEILTSSEKGSLKLVKE
jgi:bifunctional DNase/RNase